jgi:hypothetical protein
VFRRRRAVVALAVVFGAGLAFVRAERSSSPGPAHPKQWDAKVLPLVRFVEETRGLRFRHPVAVDYLSDADFRRAVVDEPGVTEQGLAQPDAEAAARALGLPTGKNGLVTADNTLSGEGVTAYYDDATERVAVRGADLTVGRRGTIVHELTHALQDQYFDISRDGSYSSDDRNGAFDAVVEGDAVRLEDAYVDSLPRADQDAYDQEQAAADAAYNAGITAVPDWLSATSDFPYTVGEPFVEALDGADGRQGVDRALRTPPPAEAEVMDAARYLRGDRPRNVPVPAPPAGMRVVKRNDLGALRWLLVLAERIPAADALQAVDGWDGDSYLVYEQGGRVCVKADFAGVGRSATDGMAAALDRWTANMPAASGATVTRPGAVVELASCDPGATALPGPSTPDSHVDEAMKLLTDRAGAFVTAVDNGEAHVSPKR